MNTMHPNINIYSAAHNDNDFANLQVKFNANNEENVLANADKIMYHLEHTLGSAHYKCIMAETTFSRETIKTYVQQGVMHRLDSDVFGVLYTNCPKVVTALEDAINQNIK